MSNRFEQLRELLDSGQYFKLVCGAGNENSDEVRKLAMVYTIAGANGFDISATPQVVDACMDGIDKGLNLAGSFNRDIAIRPFVTVSVGMRGDHHVRKAFIVDDCVECGKCIPVCPTDAIPESYDIIQELCIGCGNCEAACPPKVAAVKYEHNSKELAEILPRCLQLGAENIELHAAVPDDESIMQEWKTVSECQPSNFISMCLDRLHLSNHHLIDRIIQAEEIAGERLMIQADGIPMSGGADDYNTTLQAISIADIVNKDLKQKHKKYKNLPVLLSGGTNGKTGEMAKQCGVDFNGVSIGTHARKIVEEYLNLADFEENISAIRSAVDIADDLVRRSLR